MTSWLHKKMYFVVISADLYKGELMSGICFEILTRDRIDEVDVT